MHGFASKPPPGTLSLDSPDKCTPDPIILHGQFLDPSSVYTRLRTLHGRTICVVMAEIYLQCKGIGLRPTRQKRRFHLQKKTRLCTL